MWTPAAAPVAPRAASLPQLQAAQPPSKPGPTESERAFYDRVFSGAPGQREDAVELRSEGPSDPTLPALKADVEKLLAHLSRTRTAWRSGAGLGEALARRAEEVSALGGVPRRAPKGLFGSRVVVEPLDADVLAQLPRMARTFRLIARSERQDYSDFLYSVNVLTGRAASRRAFAEDLAWLYRTYDGFR